MTMYNKVEVIRWILGNIPDQMRAPTGGLGGWLAKKIMETNASSTREAIRRLELNQDDTFVELGIGHGESLRKIAEMDKLSFPKRIVCVEISESFRNELQQTIAELPTKLPIEIYAEDCIKMPYLDDGTVTKMFGMNLVYFLNPLPEYLMEINRVMKQNGKVVFGCKFGVVPTKTNEFVNKDPKSIVNAMKEAGFDVTAEKVEVYAGNYLEIKGTKR
jgi:ubiquinone/menaquinone biosynthesis C-methylase UbiE